MKYGERIETVITRLDEKGRGLGPVLTRQAAARYVIPGEKIAGKFVGKDKGFIKLEGIEVLEASPDRVKPECPHFTKCGGCSFQHINAARQSALKLDTIRQALKEGGIDLSVEGITSAETIFRYRNRMDYVFGRDGELGLKEPGHWDKPVDLTTCLLMSEDANRVRLIVRDWARATGLPFWDNKTYAGFFRYLVIRESSRTGERMAMLVTHTPPEGLRGASLWNELVEKLSPYCTTIYHGINPNVTDVSIANELHLLHGKERLHETVDGVTFSIHPNSFFQTNTVMAEKLLSHVRELVMSDAHGTSLASDVPRLRLLDLYCGSGFFSLALAKDVERALGIELDAHGIAMAKENATANGIANAEFRAEPAELLSWVAEKPDVAVIDPPRSGLHPKVTMALRAGRPPRIVYVSCNPKALANDLKTLLHDYEATSVRAFDLFPQTPHVETVVHLKLKSTP